MVAMLLLTVSWFVIARSQALCVSERNKQYEEMGATYLGGASSLVLAIESVGQATNEVFLQQGAVLSLVSGWLAAQPDVSSGSLLEAMGGLAVPQQIPRILQVCDYCLHGHVPSILFESL